MKMKSTYTLFRYGVLFIIFLCVLEFFFVYLLQPPDDLYRPIRIPYTPKSNADILNRHTINKNLQFQTKSNLAIQHHVYINRSRNSARRKITNTHKTTRMENGILAQKLLKTLYLAWGFARGTKANVEIRKAIRITESIFGSYVRIDKKRKSAYVCPEKFINTTYGYPFFYKGFEITNCSIKHPISTFMSIALYIDSDKININDLLTSIRKNYKHIPIYISCERDQCKSIVSLFTGITFISTTNADTGQIWNTLVHYVKTRFVLIGRDIAWFDSFDARLERLVRVLDEVGVKVASGARRNLKDGVWHNGCYQSVVRNYTLAYTEGYDASIAQCLYCDYVTGPFVSRVLFLKKVMFSESMYGDVLFREWYIRLQQLNHDVLSCPDSMFYTLQMTKGDTSQRSLWNQLAMDFHLNKIVLNPDISFDFDCNEANLACQQREGTYEPPCCLQKLADAIKFIMTTCEKESIICELQEGTLLGVMKFNKVLPWERDADLTFLTDNFTALTKLEDKLLQFNMFVRFNLNSVWCCVDNIQAGGTGKAYFDAWMIELYGQHTMDTKLLLERGLTATKVNFDGLLVNVPRNPGLHVRNRYGPHIYKHVEHWFHTQAVTGWDRYIPSKFHECINISHGCLEPYFVDGNVQFQDVIP